jgi:tetratricopeptide (TPR) repeat protein
MRVVADDLQGAFPAEQAIALFQPPPGNAALAQANDRLMVRIYAVAKKYDQAVDLLDALIVAATTDAQRAGLLHEKGTILQQAEKYDDSVLAYEQALEYERNNWITLNNLAYVLSDAKGEDDRALPYARRAVALADNAFTLDTLGWIYAGLGKHAEAVAELSRAIRHDPEYAWAYFHLGETHRRSGKLEDAKSVLTSGREVALARSETEVVTEIEKALKKIEEAAGG